MSVGEFVLAMDGVAIANGTYKQRFTWDDVLDFEAKLNGKNNP